MLPIPITLLHPNAKVPSRAHETDAGYDLYAAEDTTIIPGQRALVRTGVAMAIPQGYYGRIAPRSGLALKQGVDVLGGVVDATFRGDIGVILINLTLAHKDGTREDGDDVIRVFDLDKTVTIKAGDRIAQLIIERCYDVEWQPVGALDSTDRGTGGYGSSGA